MATTNNKFLVKNGLAVGSSIDVINTSGEWVGATGTLHGATGPQGASGVQGIDGASGYVGSDGATGATGPTGATGTSGDRYLTTSNTSFTLADTGSQTVTVGLGLAYSANQTIILTYDPSNHQHGRVTSYNPSTGSLVFDKYDFQGSGTYASWTVNLDGAVGAQGASGVQGASGLTGATGISGASGITGASGSAGANGATGTAGTNGATGPQGTQGIQGVQGASGATGTAGTNGATGSVNLFTAQFGPQTGATGATGSVQILGGLQVGTGATGATGTITSDKIGINTTYFDERLNVGGGAMIGTSGGSMRFLPGSGAYPAGNYIQSGSSTTITSTADLTFSGMKGTPVHMVLNADGGLSLGKYFTVGTLTGATGATGSITATGRISATSGSITTGATGYIGASGSIGAPSGYFNNLFVNGIAVSGGGASAVWSRKTTTYTAVAGDLLIADTTSGAFTITLPATPSTGSAVSFADPAGTWATNNLTIARNGSTIEGAATNLTLDVSNVRVDLVYDGSTWQLFTNLGPVGASGVLTPWTKVTSTTTLAKNALYIIDTTSGSFTVNLPASPSLGDQVVIQDGGNFSTNNLTIARNGSTIEGQADNILADVGGVLMTLIYDGSTWQISINTGAAGATGVVGATGPAGVNGATGTAGVNGATGPSGGGTAFATTSLQVTGTNGATGATGSISAGHVVIGASSATAGYKLDVVGNFKVSGSIDENVYAVVDAAGVPLSPQNGTIQTWTLGASRTPTAGTWEAGESMTLMINDGTAFTVTWTTLGVVWVGGTAPTLALTGFTVIQLWKVSTTIYGALVGNVA